MFLTLLQKEKEVDTASLSPGCRGSPGSLLGNWHLGLGRGFLIISEQMEFSAASMPLGIPIKVGRAIMSHYSSPHNLYCHCWKEEGSLMLGGGERFVSPQSLFCCYSQRRGASFSQDACRIQTFPLVSIHT